MTKMRFVLLVTTIAVAACGPAGRKNPGGDDDGTIDAAEPDLYCPTSISGKVYAPNGTLPLYNVTVYAPISDPPPFEAGVQCQQCSTSLPGGAFAVTTSDTDGTFKLEGIPPGTDIPVIITTGKWRRRLTVPSVVPCQDNAIPDGTFRLPKNKTEGELPRIAIVTGGCDALACIFSKLGIDTAEFGASSASAASVVFYNGDGGSAPGSPQPSTALHGNLNEMKKFDVVVNSCECSEVNTNKTSPDLLRQYADIGGRVLGSHFHYTWSKNLIPAWQGMASWTSGSTTGPDIVDQSHAGGMAMAKWLTAVGASSAPGQITLGTKTNNASGIGTGATRWLQATGSGSTPTTHYMSWNTPVGAEPQDQCGKVVYAGMHVSSGSVGSSFPASCGGGFTPDEKAFAFLLFELTTCLGPIF